MNDYRDIDAEWQEHYEQRRIANLMHQFNCARETAVRIVELREEGYPLHQAALMAGATDPKE